jgi:hypothetical protein
MTRTAARAATHRTVQASGRSHDLTFAGPAVIRAFQPAQGPDRRVGRDLVRGVPAPSPWRPRAVIDLRCFLDDLALWGWAERPPRRLLFPADIPRLDKPLLRALPPDTEWPPSGSWLTRSPEPG